VSVVVESLGQQSSPVRVMMVDANPALFTVNGRGNGQAVAENGDGTANSPTNPVRPGSFLTLFGTGEGLPDRDPGPQGGLVPVEPWLVALPKEPVRVFFGNEEADLVYAGPMPGGIFWEVDDGGAGASDGDGGCAGGNFRGCRVCESGGCYG
jgi:uncharacterized protein (TIGR03437 family)